MKDDFGSYMHAKDFTNWKRAEWENSIARYELAQQNERCAMLMSQHEPVASLGLDRERLRLVLAFVKHGDLQRLDREFLELRQSQA